MVLSHQQMVLEPMVVYGKVARLKEKGPFADGEREHGPFRSCSRDEMHVLGVHTSVHCIRQAQ